MTDEERKLWAGMTPEMRDAVRAEDGFFLTPGQQKEMQAGRPFLQPHPPGRLEELLLAQAETQAKVLARLDAIEKRLSPMLMLRLDSPTSEETQRMRNLLQAGFPDTKSLVFGDDIEVVSATGYRYETELDGAKVAIEAPTLAGLLELKAETERGGKVAPVPPTDTPCVGFNTYDAIADMRRRVLDGTLTLDQYRNECFLLGDDDPKPVVIESPK